MRLLILVFNVLLAICSPPAEAKITFENNGYNDVIVAISPDVPVTNAENLLQSIQTWIKEGSSFLYSASKHYSYIRNVKILVPKSWNYASALPTSEVSFEDGDIVVDTGNPAYGDVPYTIQTGQCGESGENIMVPKDYLLNLDSSSTENYGPPSHVFVHEWAKYRYGVFEEHGYPEDDTYPMFYLKSEYTSEGLVKKLVPNFCTNKPLQGRWTDNFETCSLGDDNTPGPTCFFVPDTGSTNDGIKSSIMAVPFLQNMDHFCEDNDGGFSHDFLGPTKHNALCDSRSVWDVISSNADFQDANFQPGDQGSSNETTFEILRPDEARFVMVIDKSGSMDGPKDHPRINRLKQASSRWILNDIWDGTSLGVTSFCYDVDIDIGMTVVSEETRKSLADAVLDIQTCDYTCLGYGFKKGIEVLTDKWKNNGGVMIYITDGDWNCDDQDGHDDSNLNDPTIKKLIEDFNIKIITLAFSEGADPNLENLAKWSNGKTYFIPDEDGIEDLNDALSGSLTYQPAVPTGDMEFIILQDSVSDFENPDSDEDKRMPFIIDRTIGRDVKFSFDFTGDDIDSFRKIRFFKPDCQNSECIKNIDLSDIKTLHLQHIEPTLEEGLYQLEIVTSKKVKFCSVVVASKSKEETVKPFRTKCWATIGNEETDVGQYPVGVIAQVTQDNKPVMNAKVMASIEKSGEANALVVELFDDGKGPDLIANDGLYSRYVTRFDDDGRYLIRCQVQGDENTNVNGGFTNGRIYPAQPGLAAPLCCGSNTLMSGTIQEPTGDFERKAAGGSIKVKNVNGLNQVPPLRIKDLKATYDLDLDTISIGFTAPGDKWDVGTAESYSVRFSESLLNLTSIFDDCEEIMKEWVVDGSLEPLEAREHIHFKFNATALLKDTIYYFGVKATNKNNVKSDLSNTVSLALAPRTDLPDDPEDPKGLSAGAIAGIVIGSILGLFIVIFIVYVLVVKRWRKKLVYKVSPKTTATNE